MHSQLRWLCWRRWPTCWRGESDQDPLPYRVLVFAPLAQSLFLTTASLQTFVVWEWRASCCHLVGCSWHCLLDRWRLRTWRMFVCASWRCAADAVPTQNHHVWFVRHCRKRFCRLKPRLRRFRWWCQFGTKLHPSACWPLATI